MNNPLFEIDQVKAVLTVDDGSQKRISFYSTNNNFGPFYIGIYHGPTHNCQICSMASIEHILDLLSYISSNVLNKLFEQLMINLVGKQLILIDIHQDCILSLEKMLDKISKYKVEIYTRTYFISTNNSKRFLILLKINER